MPSVFEREAAQIIERFWGPNYPLPDLKETLARAFTAFYNDGYKDAVNDSINAIKDATTQASLNFKTPKVAELEATLKELC